METISILGCGWLGLPLADYLIEKGYKLKGSTRTRRELEVIKSHGIEPFYLVLDPDLRGDNVDDFFDCDVLVVNFPPERRDDIAEYHPAQIRSLIARMDTSPVKKVLFVSSTSVYPDLGREVSEDEDAPPEKPSGIALLKAERLFRRSSRFETTIIRFGGLIGYDRMPGRFLAGRKGITGGNSPVNLIHRDDCLGIIYRIIKRSMWGETFNACADEHPLRKEYYTAQALKLGLDPPGFEDGGGGFKIIRSDKLKKRLEYRFKYPDPRFIDD
ncbi:MAG TPA: SDR family oxidoreductase [Thermodesulfobacteriota bacterium]|nr:SDR family oxidoreductase [Thermodesulfobacteriota bacterium]